MTYTVMIIGFSDVVLGLTTHNQNLTTMGLVLIATNALYNLYKINKMKTKEK